jgi:hypothetical protein
MQTIFSLFIFCGVNMPRAQKGQRFGGRQKGTPNKVSTTVKENVIQVFQQLGGAKAMAEWAKDNPTHFYNLYAKLLPQDINKTVEHKIPTSIVFNAVDMSRQVEYVDKDDIVDVEMKG